MMLTKVPRVSLAILNWNGLEDTEECLKSVRALTYPHLEVILVDNGSDTRNKEGCAKQEGVTYLDLPVNTGFTGGHLAAEEKASGDYIVLLNNDLVLDPHWIERCLEVFERHPEAGIVGGKVYRWDSENPPFDSSNAYDCFQKVDPQTGYTQTLQIGEEERPVDALSGAALMVKREILKTIGYLDDTFFAYYEETDLIARAWRAGFSTYYTPHAMSWHKIAQSSSGGQKGAFYLYQMHRNRYLFAAKNFDGPFWKLFKRYYLKEVLKAFIKFFLYRDLQSKSLLKAYFWVLKNRQRICDKRKAVLQLGTSYVNHLGVWQPNDVTVVISCYNYGPYVAEAIESVLAQTVQPKKVIVVNDGSTDNSQELIDRYQHHPLFEIHHLENGGVVAARNFALSRVKTTWTIFLDADDLFDKEYLEKTLQKAHIDQVDVVYTDIELFGAKEGVFHAVNYSKWLLLSGNYIHNSSLIATTFLKQIGGYKSAMREGLEDWELFLSLTEVGARFGYLSSALLKQRKHEGGVNRNAGVKGKERMLYQQVKALHPNLYSPPSLLRNYLYRAKALCKRFSVGVGGRRDCVEVLSNKVDAAEPG